MDQSFATAVRAGTDALHRADPSALAALEGVQLPGWGGYDYARLAPAVDLMEIYPDGENLEIAQDLHPGLVVLTTVPPAASSAPAIWDALLRGARGLILWDENGALARPDGSDGPEAAAFATLLDRVRAVAAPLRGTVAAPDPVAILYSQASFRARWMADRRPQGDAWVTRGAEGENDDNAWRHAMRTASAQLLRLGMRARWVAAPDLATGLGSARVLLLPQSVALSPAERQAIATFVAHGGTVIADTPPGTLDEHLRPQPPLNAETRIAVEPGLWNGDGAEQAGRLANLLAAAGVRPRASIADEHGKPVPDLAARWRATEDGLLLSLFGGDGPATVRLDCPAVARSVGKSLSADAPETPPVRVALGREAPTLLHIRLTGDPDHIACEAAAR
ncbi:MAG: hypothetical protein JO326_02605 [Acetobacteraceae bacterium]|nr:hypothetical protein [Acetobacteraceae bacterium]